jgi:hypothetical protein
MGAPVSRPISYFLLQSILSKFVRSILLDGREVDTMGLCRRAVMISGDVAWPAIHGGFRQYIIVASRDHASSCRPHPRGTGLDGEGRYTKVTASSGTNPVTAVTYSTTSTADPLGSLLKVTFGSADFDSFTYNPESGRMATYTLSVNSVTDKGTLTWNTNGTLKTLAIVDGISGTSDSQTCNYVYDDAQRVSSAN